MINLKKLKKDVAKVLSYSQVNGEAVNTDELIDKWLVAKQFWIEKLGDKLIYEYPNPISFTLNEEDKIIKINDFIALVKDTYNNEMLGNFLEAEKDGFWDNIVLTPYQIDGDIEVAVGQKLLKAFKFFELNIDILNEIQNKASELIQQNKITGYLCISVHPLDFLSCSENNYDWTTCLSLQGSYRTSCLSYMLDESSFLCYLKSDKKVQLQHFPKGILWNDKKWRTFLFLSNEKNLIFSGKHYPFFSTSALDIIKNIIFPILNFDDNWNEWHNDFIDTYTYHNGTGTWFIYNYYPIGNFLIPLSGGKEALIENTPKSQHFNDIVNSTSYNPYYIFNNNAIDKIPKIRMGAPVKCIKCGNNLITEPNIMLCQKCNYKNTIKEN